MQQNEDYLQHWGIEKGGKKQNHKYYMRVDSGNPKKPYIYFYSQAEYQAWLNKGDKNSPVKKRAQKKLGMLDRMKDISNKPLKFFDKNGNGKLDLVDSIENRISLSKKKKATTKADNKSKENSARENSEKNVFSSKRQEKLRKQAQADREANKRQSDRSKRESAERNAFSKKHANENEKYSDNGHDKEPKDHKYVAKLLVDGKYRYFYSSKELSAFYNKNPQYKDESMSGFKLINKAETESDSQRKINSNFDKASLDGFSSEPGWTNNCYDCTLAYEARRRGYDVEAIYDTNGASYSELSDLYEGVKSPYTVSTTNPFTKKTTYHLAKDSGWDVPTSSKESGKEQWDDLNNQLASKYPDGARGNLCVQWKSGSAHSMAWEKKDGEIYIHDAQTNYTIKMSECEYRNNISNDRNVVTSLRTDDKKFTKKAAEYLQPYDTDDEAEGKSKAKEVQSIDDIRKYIYGEEDKKK